MVDVADSKSVGLIPREGSNPSTGTNGCEEIPDSDGFDQNRGSLLLFTICLLSSKVLPKYTHYTSDHEEKENEVNGIEKT